MFLFFLPERPESAQLSSRTGSALLQMSGQPLRGCRQGSDAQCRGYRVKIKGDFVPREILQKTRTTQRSGVTHSLCTSAVTLTWFFFFFLIICCCRKRRVSTNDEGLWKAAATCEERPSEWGRKRRLICHLRCLTHMLASEHVYVEALFLQVRPFRKSHYSEQFAAQRPTLSCMRPLGRSMHLHRGSCSVPLKDRISPSRNTWPSSLQLSCLACWLLSWPRAPSSSWGPWEEKCCRKSKVLQDASGVSDSSYLALVRCGSGSGRLPLLLGAHC